MLAVASAFFTGGVSIIVGIIANVGVGIIIGVGAGVSSYCRRQLHRWHHWHLWQLRQRVNKRWGGKGFVFFFDEENVISFSFGSLNTVCIATDWTN